MLNGRDRGGMAPGDGETLPGDERGVCDEGADREPEGAPLGSDTVLPGGDGEAPGESEVAGLGVAAAGNGVGLGVGLGVGRAVG
ncbi:MAG: hypothetical protein H0W81_11010, partial [Chloroflexi bacterium]|nr:hypothetical protein [Chloroflexota bacterium]